MGAIRRALVLAAIVGALGAAGAGVAKPEKPPKPKLALLTESQEAALRIDAIKFEVESKRGDEARVSARLVVDGFPDDFVLQLGPERKRLRDGKAKLKLPLSARQEEVLAFAQQACDGATVDAEATAGTRTAKLEANLRSDEC